MADYFDMRPNNRGVFSSKVAGINARLESSYLGSALRRGTMESFGFHFENGVSQGFLGMRNAFSGGLLKQARQVGIKNSGKAALSSLGKAIAPGINLLFTAEAAYSGYKRGGILGAAAGVGQMVAINTAANVVMGAAGVGAIGVAGLAAAGYGAYALGVKGREYAKGLRSLEMGGGDQILQTVESAGAATMRQRAIMSINNSHINGRSALGNEAYLLHRSF